MFFDMGYEARGISYREVMNVFKHLREDIQTVFERDPAAGMIESLQQKVNELEKKMEELRLKVES